MNKLTDLEIGWVSGMIEGEGCITLSYTNTQKRRYGPYINVRLAMNDKDLILRLQQVTGIGKISPKRRISGLGKQDQWSWDVQKQSDVKDLLRVIQPLMGERRNQRIFEVLNQGVSLQNS